MVWYDAKNIDQKNLGFAIGGLAASLVEQRLPDIRGDFPNYRIWDCEQLVIGNALIVKFECKPAQIPSVGLLAREAANEILSAAGRSRAYSELLRVTALQKYFSREKFIFIVDLKDGGFEWDIAGRFIAQWIDDKAVSYALSLNQMRISRAIPTPPQYSQQEIFQALWILECEDSMSQGSAFSLDSVGLVTCEHVISETKALRVFHASTPQTKFGVKIIKAHKILDIAVLDFPEMRSRGSLSKFNGQCNLHDHSLVCGFPNYRQGDQGVFSPGVIIGTRQQSGIRRLLTNAPIVRGMSGGPAIGRNNKVIGVCVTGADRLATADDTEDKSIIPIDALALL
ncbi:MAG: serine protease [Xanthobacteraceae bacterium]